MRRTSTRWLKRIGRDTRGVAALEFAIVLPILVLLWLGGVEVTQALSVNRKVDIVAASIADLVARSRVVSEADVNDIFDIARGALHPVDDAPATMALTAIDVDDKGAAKVGWSRGRGRAAYATGAAMDAVLPANMRIANTQVIMGEASYPYEPAIGYVVSGTMQLDERAFFTPRLVSRVPLCADPNKPETCE